VKASTVDADTERMPELLAELDTENAVAAATLSERLDTSELAVTSVSRVVADTRRLPTVVSEPAVARASTVDAETACENGPAGAAVVTSEMIVVAETDRFRGTVSLPAVARARVVEADTVKTWVSTADASGPNASLVEASAGMLVLYP
jgi:hypothetical protein